MSTKRRQAASAEPSGQSESTDENYPLIKVKNLGSVSARMLGAAGIVTRGQLAELGPVRSYLAAVGTGAKPSLNLLWAIAGGLSGRHWTQVSPSEKEILISELKSLTQLPQNFSTDQ